MEINIVSAIGRGSTLLSSFDRALQKAGIHNYNLVLLSSIIPPGTKIVKNRQHNASDEDFGKKLYVVKAEIRSNETGKFIAAGLGWYQLDDKRGFFVEHEMIGETRVAVESEIEQRIKKSLQDMCRFRRIEFEKKKLNSKIALTQIKDKPTCALAVATYQSEGWKQVR